MPFKVLTSCGETISHPCAKVYDIRRNGELVLYKKYTAHEFGVLSELDCAYAPGYWLTVKEGGDSPCST